MTTNEKIEFDIMNDRDHLAFCRETLDHVARVISEEYSSRNLYGALEQGFVAQVEKQHK